MVDAMSSSKPYLARAIYEWLLDNGLTPYLAVDTTFDTVIVPEKYILDNRIVLNISPNATANLHIDNEAVTFKARFEGISKDIYVPVAAILAIYAHENNRGLVFPHEDSHDAIVHSNGTNINHPVKIKPKKPQLTLVKRDLDDSDK